MIIIIPLHIPLKYPCDYIDQTGKILSKDNVVIFFDYHLPYSWKNLLEYNNVKDLFISLFNILKLKNIIYFRAPSILPFSRSKMMAELNKKLGFVFLSIILWLFKKKVIVWQFSTLIINKIFRRQFFVYDCVDYVNSDDEHKKYLQEEEKIFKISDLVSFNSRGLFENKLKSFPGLISKSVVAVCGCNFNLFQAKINKIPLEYSNISQKKIVFMGVFDHRVDINLLKYIVKDNQNLKIIFIGPIRRGVPKLFSDILKEKNVLYLGEKRKSELPIYIKNCNLGIIPYDTSNKNVRYANPMKAYEYLASELPIISTKILALENYPKYIVHTTDNKVDFSKAINRMIGNWDSKKAKIAKDIAEKNSWENKIRIIEKFIIKNEKIGQ